MGSLVNKNVEDDLAHDHLEEYIERIEDRGARFEHEYVYEILYHYNCVDCKQWWSYAVTPNGKEDPIWTMVEKTMHCPHCGKEAGLKVKDGFEI